MCTLRRYKICNCRNVTLTTLISCILLGSLVYLVVRRCSECIFDAQVQHLMKTQMMTDAEIADLSTVYQQLQETLQERWPGCEVIPLGSSITGLAMKFSDADCMVKVPNHTIYNETINRIYIYQAVQLLKKYPKLYSNIRPSIKSLNVIAVLKFDFVATKRNCDVNFISTHALEVSKMISYYYSLDRRGLTVAAIIKLWSIVDWTKTPRMLTSYSLNMLTIFFMQQEKILPPFHLIQKTNHNVNDLWITNNTMSVYELLGRFFSYFSEFNFDDNVISVLYGQPLTKQAFSAIYGLSDGLNDTVDNNTSLSNMKLYIQDVISPGKYIIEPTKSRVEVFISRIKFAAEMFRLIPSDSFLKSVFTENNSDQFL